MVLWRGAAKSAAAPEETKYASLAGRSRWLAGIEDAGRRLLKSRQWATEMFIVLIIFLVAQRVSELVVSERNQRWAMSRGGIETGRGQYSVIVILHALFLLSLVLERQYLPRGWDPLWPFWLGILILSQLLRAWSELSLGRSWNTRIIVIPGARPVLKGPYRFIRHPNYVAVVIEILAIPMLCGAYLTAGAFSVLNAVVLYWRIREEERALDLLEGDALRRLPRFMPDKRKRLSEQTERNDGPGQGTRAAAG